MPVAILFSATAVSAQDPAGDSGAAADPMGDPQPADMQPTEMQPTEMQPAPAQPMQPAPAHSAAPPAAPTMPPAETEERAPNSIYAEGLGAGLFYSINYERLIISDLAVRVGIGIIPLSASASAGGSTSSASALYLNFPLTVSYLGLGGNSHMFEIGGGVTINYTSGTASAGVSSASGSGIYPIGTLFAGYRLHPFAGAGFNFRVGLMALLGQGLSLSNPDPDSIGVLPWFYLSLGASF